MQVSFTKRAPALESIRKRCIVLVIVVGCASYAIMLAMSPWVLIAWFLFFRK